MFFVKKFSYHPIKCPTGNENLAQQKLDKLRRTKSQSFFFLITCLLVIYIVLNVFLPDHYTWFSSMSSDYNSFNYDANSITISTNSNVGDESSKEIVFNSEPSHLFPPNHILSASSLDNFSISSDKANANETVPMQPEVTSRSMSNVNATTTADETILASDEEAFLMSSLSQSPEKVLCQIPKLDPFDRSIRHLIKPLEKVQVDCTAKFPLLFGSPSNSTIIPVAEAIREAGFFSCCYRIISRRNYLKIKRPDEKYKTSEKCYPISLESETIVQNPEHEFIAIYCKNQTGNIVEEKIVDMHILVHLKPSVEKRIQSYYRNLTTRKTEDNKTPDVAPSKGYALLPKQEVLLKESERLNVVILGIDAVSHMNFLRSMPKSYSYLVNNLSSVEMQGFNKIGDNTFPNMAAVLTSLNTTQMKTCEKNETFDECPFIWKDFASQGFRTSYGEDSTWMGIFNYIKQGFRVPPTDYYLRPFGNAADELIGTNKRLNAKMCQGPRLGFHILLEFMQKLAYRMGHDKRYFQLIWATSLTHDYMNDAQMGDQYLFAMLQWFKNGGYLNNTALIVMSDHGIRWGDIHQFIQGEVEERLPFLYFLMPEWFQHKYSRAYENLKKNVDRLTTPYDLHETLKDLLYLDNLNEDRLINRENSLKNLVANDEKAVPTGISQFLPIPASRTCAMAGVAEHYCTCHKSTFVPQNHPVVQQVANYIVYSINLMISSYSGCSFLTLQSVKRSLAVTSEFNSWTGYQLVLETKPGGAVFESLVEKDEKGFWKVSGTISRTNLYGNQSHCVDKKDIKLYCFCVDLIKDFD